MLRRQFCRPKISAVSMGNGSRGRGNRKKQSDNVIARDVKWEGERGVEADHAKSSLVRKVL